MKKKSLLAKLDSSRQRAWGTRGPCRLASPPRTILCTILCNYDMVVNTPHCGINRCYHTIPYYYYYGRLRVQHDRAEPGSALNCRTIRRIYERWNSTNKPSSTRCQCELELPSPYSFQVKTEHWRMTDKLEYLLLLRNKPWMSSEGQFGRILPSTTSKIITISLVLATHSRLPMHLEWSLLDWSKCTFTMSSP